MPEIDIVEDFDIRRNLEAPHLLYTPIDISSKVKVAANVYIRDLEEILLISASGLGTSSVFAGLKESHLEFISLNAPIEVKFEILKLIENPAEVDDIIRIAKALDENLERGTSENFKRVSNTIQFVMDNRIAFDF